MTMTPQEWLHAYALLALRLNRQVTSTSGGTVLIYRGPQEWSGQVEAEEPVPAGRLAEDADRLLEELPFEPPRAGYLAAQVRALRAVARRQHGAELPLPEYARQCLGVDAEWVPESLFAAVHEQLDAALPRTAGSLTDRLHAWQAAHTLPADRLDRVPELVDKVVAEARARTNATIVPLPDGDVVDCKLVPDAHYLAAGHYAGGVRGTLYLNGSLPFNLADLIYVVAHEVYPGHIAESMLKEHHLVEGEGRLDQQIRFMLAPSFVLGEGIGLHAPGLVFPGDQAQAWLTEHVLVPEGIQPDGSDFATIHHAKNVFWGAWGNAALLADEGRPDSEIADYLTRWALITEAEFGQARKVLDASGMSLYILGYYHGWRLLESWLDAPDRHRRFRRLLTEQLLPADLATG